MSITLYATILIEGIVTVGYARWRAKPTERLLVVSVLANLLTQSLLWGALNLFPTHYLATLFAAEWLIWLVESIILCCFPGTSLLWREAVWLSLGMNLSSFGIGWFLPV